MYVKFLTSELFNTLIVICPQIRYTKIKIRYGGFCVGGMHDMARTVAIGLQDFGDLIQKGYFYIDDVGVKTINNFAPISIAP